jgi:hypothetical protein
MSTVNGGGGEAWICGAPTVGAAAPPVLVGGSAMPMWTCHIP